ncbi:MAG: sugar ABC transporter permease [Ktedonobacterales bacterium]|nr:sugar ABC transporter permease [Ktedonobacterales bacterium]
MATTLQQSRTSKAKRYTPPLVVWAFLIPGAILLGIFLVAPFALAVGMSFTSLRLISPLPLKFLGWQNYARTFVDPLFRQALQNNFLFALVVVPLQTSLALWMAILVNQKIRFVKFFRTLFFLPLTTVLTVAATVWSLLYIPDTGFVNGFLRALTFGHFQPHWLYDPHFALTAVMIVGIWQSAGFQMVIFLAGLQEIPEELYEAVAIDGAGSWTKFRYVTLPGLRNTLIFVVTVTTIFAFRLFDAVYIMTKGGPLGSTETMLLRVYEVGFDQQKIAVGAAISVVFFLIVLVVSIIQRIFVHEEGGLA